MNAQIDSLVKLIFQKDSLEQCSVPELRQLSGKYPYFGPLHLLLAKKLQAEDNGQYNEQVQKVTLHFQNPLWLEHLLHGTGQAVFRVTNPQDQLPDNKEITLTPVVPEVKTEPLVHIEKTEQELVPEVPVAVIEPVTEPVISPIQSELLPIPELPSLKMAPPETAVYPQLTFEPLHTIDYFASQGIKLKEEEKPTDKFGQQLKSFTDWLKTLKRLPVPEPEQVDEGSTEDKVDLLAEHSIQNREVITEAMAEVWEKQGNLSKAIEIFDKLSLLEPAKSPYFAAKIAELKKTN